VKGATKRFGKIPEKHTCFNPRAREGRDACFNFGFMRIAVSFNPRAREGRDPIMVSLLDLDGAVSIHAPVKGATLSIARGALTSEFQSTRP